MGLAEDLKTVADPQHRAAGRRMTLYRLHDRAETGNGAGAKVVAIAESARQHHHVRAAKIGVAVPDKVGIRAYALGRAQSIEVAVTAGKSNHRNPRHQSVSTSSR